MTFTSEDSSTSLTGLMKRISVEISSVTSFDQVHTLLSLIQTAQAQVNSLSLISSNDTIDDLPTSSLRVILLNSFEAQIYSKLQTRPGDFEARKAVLRKSASANCRFLSTINALNIMDEASTTNSTGQQMLASLIKVALSKDASPLPSDPTNRRAAKIAALKLERSYRTVLDEFRSTYRASFAKRRVINAVTQGWSNEPNGGASTSATHQMDTKQVETEYDLLILPAHKNGDDDVNDVDDDDDVGENFVGRQQGQEQDIKTPTSLRSYLKVLCQLHALLSLNALDSTYTELALLSNMPADAESQSRERAGQERGEMRGRGEAGYTDEWKLDQRWGASNSTPLLDEKGKPQRPFTILPSGSTTARGQASMGAATLQHQMDARQSMRDQVFQPSHRLPTMSIDEYLAEEQRRGNIISGGGKASADAPTSSELLALRSQGQGVSTQEADGADEEQRRKAVDWDEFTENNPKGMGNTMNRG